MDEQWRRRLKNFPAVWQRVTAGHSPEETRKQGCCPREAARRRGVKLMPRCCKK